MQFADSAAVISYTQYKMPPCFKWLNKRHKERVQNTCSDYIYIYIFRWTYEVVSLASSLTTRVSATESHNEKVKNYIYNLKRKYKHYKKYIISETLITLYISVTLHQRWILQLQLLKAEMGNYTSGSNNFLWLLLYLIKICKPKNSHSSLKEVASNSQNGNIFGNLIYVTKNNLHCVILFFFFHLFAHFCNRIFLF